MVRMMKLLRLGGRVQRSWKAARQLGLRQVGYFTLYQLELRSGYLRWATRPPPPDLEQQPMWNFLPLFSPEDLSRCLGAEGASRLLVEADEIVAGYVRLFGGPPVALRLAPEAEPAHWTVYERGRRQVSDEDVKFIWEPGRFGWAYSLGRAYRLSGDERYPAAFWRLAEQFLEANPAGLGPHWVSAQEVALRLIAFTFAGQIFAASPHSTPERQARLAQAIGAHAARIPPTLGYALAQNNNHLLSEAAGLYTAGLALPDHPSAARWRNLGWRLFHQGLLAQIAPDGAYAQHSANYQRLMLQLALWMHLLGHTQGQQFPEVSVQRLAQSTRWLAALLDSSGQVPNLGPNDGAYILPLTACPFEDYRPVLQAASAAFLGETLLASGPWDEMSAWFCPIAQTTSLRQSAPTVSNRRDRTSLPSPVSPHVLRTPEGTSWAYLRAERFHSRPGHADQLHLDLWWRGLNVAQDAGTYLYNAPPPWQNALAGSTVHNTLTVNGLDQMLPAGRFLYLDWAQASVLARQSLAAPLPEAGRGRGVGGADDAGERLTAQHDGYRRLGLLHRRIVTAQAGPRWLVEDILMAASPASSLPTENSAAVEACLNWLLPDWPWEVQASQDNSQVVLMLQSPYGALALKLAIWPPGIVLENRPSLQLVRAGEVLLGAGEPAPVWGWSSPTYGVKIPALAARFTHRGSLPLQFSSEWIFPAGIE